MTSVTGVEALRDVRGVDHIGIAVTDLDAAVALHTQVLGLTVTHTETIPEQGVAEVMLGGGPETTTQVQLVAALDPSSPVQRFLDRHGPGLHHLAYRVDDLPTASALLLRQGFRLLYDAPKGGTRGSLINFVHPRDAGGVLIELVQPAAPARGRG